MKWDNFSKWFNSAFWRALRSRAFPLAVPNSRPEREAIVRSVYESIISARYASSIPEVEIVLNKGHGVARTVPVFCIQDYIVYYFCIKELEDVLCGNRTANTFGGWTLGGKMRKLEDVDIAFDTGFSSARYSFNPRAWTQAFGEFNSLLFAQLDAGVFTHVLQFDLSNFYDCIRLDILERWIREEADASKGWVIALLFFFLNQWNRRNTGLYPQAVGIPQDALADCSRILANFYLQRYDSFAANTCARARALYFRYADDQMILLNGADHAESLMLLLTRHLDRFGLRVNQKKVHLWTVGALYTHRCRNIQAIFAKAGDNQDPVLVRRFAEAYLAIPSEDLSSTWNEGLPLLNRLLWANIESLPNEILDRLMLCYTANEYLLRAEIEKLDRVFKLNRAQDQPLDLERRLGELADTTVHNAFHYEVLSFARARGMRDLAAHCEARLASIEQLMQDNHVH